METKTINLQVSADVAAAYESASAEKNASLKRFLAAGCGKLSSIESAGGLSKRLWTRSASGRKNAD